MLKFVFAFHIFTLVDKTINRVDSQFVFDTLQECKSAELLIQKVEDPNNCKRKFTDQITNNSIDNINLVLKRGNS